MIYLIVILISILHISSSAFDCENVTRNPDSCQLSEVSEELHLGDKFVGLEYVAAIVPSTVPINRCSGHCSARYNSQCRGIQTVIRNVSVLVEYVDGVCDNTLVQVQEDVTCGCGCRPLSCSGYSHINNDTCTCSCDHLEYNITCPEGQSFSVHTCDCECDNIVTTCLWPLVWSPPRCSCKVHVSTELILYLVVTCITCITMLLCYANIKYRSQISNLQDQLDNNPGGRMSLRQLQHVVMIQPRPGLDRSRSRHRRSMGQHQAYSGIVNGIKQ